MFQLQTLLEVFINVCPYENVTHLQMYSTKNDSYFFLQTAGQET